MTYSIWLVPAQQDKKYLGSIISNLAKSYGAPPFLPHITLYSGIRSVGLAEKAVCNCRGFPAIPVRGNGLKSSDYLWKTLYIDIKTDVKLRALNGILAKTLSTHTRYKFRPHISLMYKKMKKSERQEIALGLSIKSAFHFNRISIIRSSSHVGRWRQVSSMRLSGQLAGSTTRPQ